MKKSYLSLIILPITLLGCNEKEYFVASDDSDLIEKTPLVYTQDSIVRTYTDQKITIDLSERNSISTSEDLSINDVTNVTGSSMCDSVVVSNMTFELDTFEEPTLCQYQYSLRGVESGITFTNPRMVMNVLVEKRKVTMPNSRSQMRSLPSSELPPIQVSVSMPGSVINIDLNSQLASVYPKDSGGKNYILSSTILVLGSGEVKATTDVLNKSIVEYTSDTYDIGGITRLIYSLSDDFDGDGVGDFKVGAIDISVSSSSGNSNPETKYFQWTNHGIDIKVGNKYTIDVMDDISPECTYGREPSDIKGSCIYDSDNDSLQLVGVYAYDAIVAPTSLILLDNTKFDVTFTRTGMHDINYQVSDHNGGFATGIVRVDVKENSAPVLKDSPYIWYANENAGMSINASGLATDVDGDTITFKSVTQPTSGKVKAKISTDKSKIQLDTQVDSEGTHFFDVVLTDGNNDVTQHWVVIVNSNTHLYLKTELERTFNVDTETPLTIDISSLIEGYLVDEKASVEVKSTSGALLGSVKVSTNSKHKVIYTPFRNEIGVDDFIFEVKTNSGAEIAGNVVVHIGNPPALVISAIEATEGINDVITASVTCDYCDVSKYEYQWVIDGEMISKEKSFTITPEQRSYKVTLFVVGYDVFGQVTYSVGSFDFFKIVAGSFEHPATDCQEIFWEYNSPYVLVADDGEYWLRSGDNTYSYKTQCDMVSQVEADALDKTVGGYTLVWSYSERTNLQRFGGNTTVFSQRGKGVEFDGSLFLNGRGLVNIKNGTVNYNDFRITNSELRTKFSSVYSRVTYTSDPSFKTIDKDPDDTVQNWYMQTTDPVDIYRGVISFGGSGVIGKLRGKQFSGTYNSSRVVDLTDGDGKSIGSMTMYGGPYGFHYYVNEIILGEYLNNYWGFWGQLDHQVDLFGLCTSPTLIQLAGVQAYGCNGDAAGAKSYHVTVNNGEGYVAQWWAQ
ncbi:Ig-like domain-containing protein [Vibrio hepatarius]|uniref:Ig-like domain-containing protein n=1 Tax=Vibrio hepatarius TaxID=171383 RepID=UPI003735649D